MLDAHIENTISGLNNIKCLSQNDILQYKFPKTIWAAKKYCGMMVTIYHSMVNQFYLSACPIVFYAINTQPLVWNLGADIEYNLFLHSLKTPGVKGEVNPD